MNFKNDTVAHDCPWAEKTFRPLLEDLDIVNVGDSPKQVFIVDNTYPRILRIGVYRCLVTVQKMSLQNEERGICTCSILKKKKYLLSL